MNKVLAVSALLAATSPAFAQMTVDDIKEKDEEIAQVLARYAKKKDVTDKLEYRHAYVDLNRDNRLDAVVLLEGPAWCTPEGCTMAVLMADKIGFELVGTTGGVNLPIKVNPDIVSPYGYKPLLVSRANGDEVALKLQQRAYPKSTASLPIASGQMLSTTKTLIDK